ncbi:MAG TPA: MFS transporter, partial [Stellaceae bacterium]|nr:MFS transporter [Stellaceae bacterium]
LETSLRFATIGSLMQLSGGITSGFLIDRLGRRRMFCIAFFGASTALIVLWYLGVSSVLQFMICSGVAYYFAGLSVLGVYLYTPEIYPTRARAFGTSLGTAWLRLASMVGPMIVGFFVGSGIGTVFLVFAGFALAAGITVLFFAIETAGKPLEEISH